jgi:hypothetical protein
MTRQILDVHMHFPRNWENPEEDPAPMVDRLVDVASSAGVTRACLLTGGRFGPGYERGMEIASKYGEFFIPVAVIDPEVIGPADVERLQSMGYRGLKIIGTARDYDCADYLPTYGAAQRLGMPILFHMGVIGGGLDYSRTHPRRDAEAAQSYHRMMEMAAGFLRDVSASRMGPLHLDTIANRFPRLRIIGAHLGNQGNYEYAASVARWRHHVSFDMSGGETIERHAMERGLIGKEIGIEKLLWGSDCGMDEIREHIDRFEAMFEQLELDDDQRHRLWWANAAEIYGLQEPRFAQE